MTFLGGGHSLATLTHLHSQQMLEGRQGYTVSRRTDRNQSPQLLVSNSNALGCRKPKWGVQYTSTAPLVLNVNISRQLGRIGLVVYRSCEQQKLKNHDKEKLLTGLQCRKSLSRCRRRINFAHSHPQKSTVWKNTIAG